MACFCNVSAHGPLGTSIMAVGTHLRTVRCADLNRWDITRSATSAFSCCAAEPCNLVLKYVQMSSVAEVIQWQVNISDREN